MIYRVLKWLAGVSLHWFYREIRIVGKERIARNVPLLIAVNHQNALVDSLVIGWLVPRRVVMTAKATLLKNPFIALLFRILGVIPLRRSRDEARDINQRPDPARNAGAFHEMLQVLSRNGAVLIFPEGTSHGDTQLAPLKSGLARVALQARDTAGTRSIHIVPIGLLFESKSVPGSIVGVQVGDPVDIDTWPNSDHTALTAELTRRLRAVSEQPNLPARANKHSLRYSPIEKRLIGALACWGRFTHRLPVRVARRLAVRISTDSDQPAMFTILIGMSLVLTTYAIQLVVVGALAHSFWIVTLYLAALLAGAHWAAFEPHLEKRS